MTNWAKIYLGDSRAMTELEDAGIDLVITSPPYWHIKDYGVPGQIGYGQSLHEYLKDLYRAWRECFRVIREGGRLCINIGDQFARAAVYGRYKVIPLHAEFINQCEHIGFDFLGAIIWQKKTTMNPSGGAVVMGSYPFPPNGIVEIDYEFILIFKKPGLSKKVSPEIKAASKLTKAEWKEYFAGHWHFGGVRQVGHEAMFPEELPRRLIKMFSFVGDTVLDPFLGSGTTIKAALDLERHGVGYEINETFVSLIEDKLGIKDTLPIFSDNIVFEERDRKVSDLHKIDYIPTIQDAKPLLEPGELKKDKLYKVVQIISEDKLKLNDDRIIKFLGIKIINKDETIRYLHEKLLGKHIILKFDRNENQGGYIYLKNKIFINGYLIKSGLAVPELSLNHKLYNKYIKFMEQ